MTAQNSMIGAGMQFCNDYSLENLLSCFTCTMYLIGMCKKMTRKSLPMMALLFEFPVQCNLSLVVNIISTHIPISAVALFA